VPTLLFINISYYFNWYLPGHSIIRVWQCGGRSNGTLRAVINPPFAFIHFIPHDFTHICGMRQAWSCGIESNSVHESNSLFLWVVLRFHVMANASKLADLQHRERTVWRGMHCHRADYGNTCNVELSKFLTTHRVEMAYGGIGSIAPRVLNFGKDRGKLSASRPGRFHHGERAAVTRCIVAGRAPETLWTPWERKYSRTHAESRTWFLQPVA
jgi:hypothetical protein